jgi:flagellin
MSLNLNVNIPAFKANNRLQSHYQNLNRTVHRLTTGKKLNSSEDSPVDMAVHNVHNGRLATLDKGRQNVIDAISLVQTAEAAMGHIDNLLIKMKEIATQAANGVVTEQQRTILHSEYGSLAAEIDRIARYTTFKDIKLLDGSLSTRNNFERQGAFYTTDRRHLKADDRFDPTQNGLKIHFGPENQRLTDYYFIRIGDLTMNGLGLDNVSIETQHHAQKLIVELDSAMLRKEQNRYLMGIMQNRLEATLGFMEEEILHLSKANSILADADVAAEMTNFYSNMMLAEAATAMLAQANILPKIALKLLNS